MEIIRPFLALTVVFTLLAAAIWTLRRRPGATGRNGLVTAFGPVLRAMFRARFRSGLGSGPGGRMPPIERTGRLVLTPQHALHLVRVQGRELVVATHPQGASVVLRLPVERPASVAGPLAGGASAAPAILTERRGPTAKRGLMARRGLRARCGLMERRAAAGTALDELREANGGVRA